MTREENIRAILDTCFSESKDEIKEVALNNIMSLSADRPTRPILVKTNMILNDEDFERLRLQLIAQNKDIILLPAGVKECDRPSGEWIPKQMQHKATREVYEMAECSICGASYVRYENDDYSFDLNKPNYCPNCGAYMKGGAE